MMSHLPIHVSVVTIVEREGRFLMTLEERGLPGGPVWYFPCGALERGETLAAAARREAHEESGYLVEPLRVVGIDHGVFPDLPELFWWRFAVSARLLENDPAGGVEDDVLAVEWVPLDEIDGRRLRSGHAGELARRAMSGGGLEIDSVVLSPSGRLEGFIA